MASSQRRSRSSFSYATRSSAAKCCTSSSFSMHGGRKLTSQLPRKRAPLSDISNHNTDISPKNPTISIPISTLAQCSNKVAKFNKASPCNNSTVFCEGILLRSLVTQRAEIDASGMDCVPRNNITTTSISVLSSSYMDVCPSKLGQTSLSLDEPVSTLHTSKCSEVKDSDDLTVSAIDSVNKNSFSKLNISDLFAEAGNFCSKHMTKMEMDGKIFNIVNNEQDPQLCAAIACDIYIHLRASETKKRPSPDFMERIQDDVNSSMRAILIDWLVEVADEYRLVPDTLYLTVNYIDRYLSKNVIHRQRLQLLGVACMLIAAKYEEICAPPVEEFCYITDNTYFKEEVLEMESAVLRCLKFELTSPTAKCFLRQFICAARGINDEVPSMQLECLASYITELSLLEYEMLRFPPSLVAASAIFLAKYIIFPSKRPWNCTLQCYTFYHASDLFECVIDLHYLCGNKNNCTLYAIREKYSRHKYKFVAKKPCPPVIPREFFCSQTC